MPFRSNYWRDRNKEVWQPLKLPHSCFSQVSGETGGIRSDSSIAQGKDAENDEDVGQTVCER